MVPRGDRDKRGSVWPRTGATCPVTRPRGHCPQMSCSLSQELTGPSGNCHSRPPYRFICASDSGFLLWQKTQWGAMILLFDSAVTLLLPKNTEIRC